MMDKLGYALWFSGVGYLVWAHRHYPVYEIHWPVGITFALLFVTFLCWGSTKIK